MAVKISEKEFATWGAKGVRLPPSLDRLQETERARARARHAKARGARSPRSRRSTFWRDYGPALTAAGIGAAIGIVVTSRSQLNGLGTLSPDQAQNAQIGGQIGGAIGSLTGIPGLGQIGSLIGSLFGPSVHTDPLGIPQDTVQGVFNTTAQEMFAAVNRARSFLKLPPVSFPGIPAPGGAPMASWSTSIMAAVLFEPSLNSSSQDRLAQLREDGTMDAAIREMQGIIFGLEQWQQQITAPPPPAPPPIPSSYGAATGTAAPPAAGTYQGTQNAVAAGVPVQSSFSLSSIGAWVQANPVLAIGGAGILIFLIANSGEGSQQGVKRHA